MTTLAIPDWPAGQSHANRRSAGSENEEIGRLMRQSDNVLLYKLADALKPMTACCEDGPAG